MAYVEADSFTTEARVTALLGAYTLSASSTPTQQAVLDRMAGEALRIVAVLRASGSSATVPSGSSPVSGELARLCDEANAFLAAAYALAMRNAAGDEPDHRIALYLDAALGPDHDGMGGILGDIATTITAAGSGTLTSATSTKEILTADLLHFTELDS